MVSYLQEVFQAWRNVHWFLYHFFSLGILAKTFIAPFHRIREQTTRGFHPQEFFEVLIINIVTRCVGMIVRAVVIFFGLAAQLMAFVLGTGFLLAALFAPILVPAAILYGFLLAIF